MRWRLERGYALHHPLDGSPDGSDGADVPDAPDPIHPDELMPGVEMDRSKGRLAWRARPRWRDCRVKCGRFPEYRDAAEAVKAFYADRWGYWDEARPWLRMSACLAVVRVGGDRRWHDLEFLDGVGLELQRQAAAAVVTAEPYETWWQAEAALRRELARLAGR